MATTVPSGTLWAGAPSIRYSSAARPEPPSAPSSSTATRPPAQLPAAGTIVVLDGIVVSTRIVLLFQPVWWPTTSVTRVRSTWSPSPVTGTLVVAALTVVVAPPSRFHSTEAIPEWAS
jgi:hypothetical protein